MSQPAEHVIARSFVALLGAADTKRRRRVFSALARNVAPLSSGNLCTSHERAYAPSWTSRAADAARWIVFLSRFLR